MDPETQAAQIFDVESSRHVGECWSALVGAAYQGLLAAGISRAAAVRLVELKFATAWMSFDDDDE
jgi:hypothetical protein